MNNIYLGKKGQVTGPMSVAEYEGMKASGKIDQFSWIWNADMRQWIPLDPPPAPISAGGEEHTPKAQKRASVPEAATPHPAAVAAQAVAQVVELPKAVPIKFGSLNNIEALCHDFRSIVQGSLQEPTSLGCSLVTPEDLHTPKLGGQGKVMLNLLNTKSGEMVTFPAQVTGVTRSGKGWSYQIRWENPPKSFFA